jgi:inorganic pyrophosphatase
VDSEEFIVLVEIPTGSRNKYEYDPALGGIVLDRASSRR